MRKAERPDPEVRVVSAVWTLLNPSKDVSELRLTWPLGDKRQGSGEQGHRYLDLAAIKANGLFQSFLRWRLTVSMDDEVALSSGIFCTSAVLHNGGTEGLHAHPFDFTRGTARTARHYLRESHILRKPTNVGTLLVFTDWSIIH